MFVKLLTGLLIWIGYSSHSWGVALQDLGNGTIRDYDTGLYWQRVDDGTPRHWSIAQSYCNSLTLAGKSNWRLPNSKELVSIIDLRKLGPAIDKDVFLGAKSSLYWTASIWANNLNGTIVWAVDFDTGAIEASFKTASHYVRCVR